jgi:hypothetical protein
MIAYLVTGAVPANKKEGICVVDVCFFKLPVRLKTELPNDNIKSEPKDS